MSYTVTAPLVIATAKDGQNHHVYQGGVIAWLPKEQAEHFLAEGLVEKSGEAGSSDDDSDGAPAKAASKAEWVDYAVEKGYDRAEVEEMTKADIQELDFA